jgi:hypothetical protein
MHVTKDCIRAHDDMAKSKGQVFHMPSKLKLPERRSPSSASRSASTSVRQTRSLCSVYSSSRVIDHVSVANTFMFKSEVAGISISD